MGFASPFHIGIVSLKGIFVNGSCSTSFHLFKVVYAFHITHKQQHFQRFHICSRCNHIHRNRNAWMIGITKTVQHRFWVFFYFVRQFLAEIIALVKFFTNDFDYIVGVAVCFGKNQCFRHFVFSVFVFSVRENFSFQCLFVLANDIAYLTWVDHLFIQIVFQIFGVFIFLLPTSFSGEFISSVYKPTCFYYAAILRYFCFNIVHIVRNIYTI